MVDCLIWQAAYPSDHDEPFARDWIARARLDHIVTEVVVVGTPAASVRCRTISATIIESGSVKTVNVPASRDDHSHVIGDLPIRPGMKDAKKPFSITTRSRWMIVMKVLFPTDGSEMADQAADFIRLLASNRPVELTVQTVSFVPRHYSVHPWVPEWIEVECERAKSLLDHAADSLRDVCGSVVTTRDDGAVVPAILQLAREMDADLIVLGAKGLSSLSRVLLGSISEHVASHAECSVVVVRPPANASRRVATDSADRFKRMVLGFDQSTASGEAVAELAQWNLPSDREIDIVSVVMHPYVYSGGSFAGPPITIDPQQVDDLTRAANEVAERLAVHCPHTRTQMPVADHAGEAIVAAAEKADADLIVLGDTSHGWLGRLFLGSTSRYVLRHAPCSVWISRHHHRIDADAAEETDAIAAI